MKRTGILASVAPDMPMNFTTARAQTSINSTFSGLACFIRQASRGVR
jgi:hypothetical protein